MMNLRRHGCFAHQLYFDSPLPPPTPTLNVEWWIPRPKVEAFLDLVGADDIYDGSSD